MDVELPEPLKIASFNVQIFGENKLKDKEVQETLVKIINRYDVILIQEIRDSSNTAIYYLLEEVNKQTTEKFDISISARLGRTTSKEQYAFLYRTNRLSVKDTYHFDDGSEKSKTDTFQREPYIVRFESPTTAIKDFAFMAIHTQPSDAVNEIDALVDVYDDVVKRWSLRDVIIMGDFNSAKSYVQDDDWKIIRLATDKRFHWLITDSVDTTVASGVYAYDRFVAAGKKLLQCVVPGSAGRFEFDKAYGLTTEQTELISDHYPIEMQIKEEVPKTIQENIVQKSMFTLEDKQTRDVDPGEIKCLRNKSKNPLLENGFLIETLYSSRRSIRQIMLSKNIENAEDATKAMEEIHSAFPSLVTKPQVLVTKRRFLEAFVESENEEAFTENVSFHYNTELKQERLRVKYLLTLKCKVSRPTSTVVLFTKEELTE